VPIPYKIACIVATEISNHQVIKIKKTYTPTSPSLSPLSVTAMGFKKQQYIDRVKIHALN
jgi:hypothetical protein